MSLGNTSARLLIVISGFYWVLPANAALLDDFNSYTAGQVQAGVTGGVWTALGNADGGVIQNESGNLLLTVGSATAGANVNVFRPIPNIAQGATSTVFMRVRANVTAGLNGSFGLTDLAPVAATDVAQFEAQFRLITNAGVPALEARNAGAFQTLLSPITQGQWYNVWMVVNNSSDTWDAYVNTGTANATAGDLKLSNVGFRNGAATNPLTHFDLFGGAGGILGESVDDIHINAGTVLTNFALPPLMLGDTDGDGLVEYPDDFNPIRDNFQKSVTLRTQGDLNRDGKVEFLDFREWKNAFLGGGGSLAGIDLSFASVPEPTSIGLLSVVVALYGISGIRRRRDS